jgi:NitT/TauT family transport system ATP-binding protein
MTAASSKLEMRNVGMEFSLQARTVEVLADINMSIETNEFVCLIGPSGSGKTTLLNLMAGFLEPTRGTILRDGAPITGPGPDRVVVFQNDAVFPWMTVQDNIAYGLRRARVPKDVCRRNVEELLHLVGLEEFARSWPHQLSGGMRKRVDLARALAVSPEIMLMDEPFGALDIMTKEKLQMEVGRLWQTRPRTTVFVTHDIEEAIFLGDKVVVLSVRPGRIHSMFPIGFERPRKLDLKTSMEFVQIRQELRTILSSLEG